jgi:hypothetical protein
LGCNPESEYEAELCQPDEVPPVPPLEPQAEKAKLYATGVDPSASLAVVAVMDICDALSGVGAVEKVAGFGVGAVVSLRVERVAPLPNDVSTLFWFLALTAIVYEVLLAMLLMVRLVSCASVSQTAEAEALPEASMYLLLQLLSLVVTWAAKYVVGFALGLLFSLLVMTMEWYEALESVGAEGVLAYVYVVFCDEAVPVLGMASRDCTVYP